MFILGVILVIAGLLTGITILWAIGAVLVVVGVVGNGYAQFGPAPAAGRRRYWY